MSNRTSDGETDHAQILESLASRRKVLASTAAIGAAALAGCTGSDAGDAAGAATTETTTTTTTAEETTTESEMQNPDVDVLNYALTLEHLEYAFYRDGLEMFDDDQLMSADPLQQFGSRIRKDVPGRLKTIRDHEKAHVDTISSVVEDLGGDPVMEAEYNWNLDSPAKFLATAKVLENTGVSAYKGAAPAVKSNDLLAAALGIHSVEARHAEYLNMLNGKVPFPEAFDPALTPSEVTEAANPFFQADITENEITLDSDGEPTAERKAEDDTSDVDVLNYALTLEHLEYAFYRDGLDAFSADEIRNADRLKECDPKLRETVPMRLEVVRDHEKAHVDAISSTVKKLGGDPVVEAEYTFEYNNPSKFIETAQILENTGVAAYAGAAPTVKNDKVFGAAAAIHSVEARHAGFLNELNAESPYPKAVDEAKTIQEVTEAVQPFIK